jgi:Bifunctional DNA primase/polymerase, N-terminal/Primase C terminal 1 (PriCT-1)
MQRSLISTALTLAHRGKAVLPCLPCDKRPATARGLKDATTNLDTIRDWWRREPLFNVAVVTGAVSGFFVVDIDGADAEVELRKLERELGELPATVEVITPRGRHIYFKTPESPVPNSAGKIALGIDVRGDGGYVLAPPSIHPSGREYAWSVDTTNTIATAPDWLLVRVTKPHGAKNKSPAPPSDWRALVADGVEQGQRDITVTRLCGYLLRHYVDPFIVLEILQLWNLAHCRPPLTQRDIERIVASIAGKEIIRRYGHGGQ